MRAILFRKLVIEGVNYYQFYAENDDFTPDLQFADYENRHDKDYFYVDLDSDIKIDDVSLLNIYCDSNDKIVPVSDYKLFEKVFMVFKDKFNIVIHEIKSTDEIADEVDKTILFQRNAVLDLVDEIYLNQSIMASDLPVDLKLKLKNNILFHGPFGSGKKTIIECLEKELNIPYADVTIGGELKDGLESIIKQLLSRAENATDASHGIVFIRDNFIKLMEIFGDGVYTVPSFFTDKGLINYNGNIIDFRTLTFVVLFDERVDVSLDNMDLQSIMTMTDCTFDVSTNVLTNEEKYEVLFSSNGRLHHYEKFLNQYGKELIVDENSLKSLIESCSKVDPGMNILHSVIDGIMKEGLLNGINDIFIDENCVNVFVPAIESFWNNNETKEIRRIEEKKNVEDIFDSELKDLFAKITSDVVGQDEQVKSILYTILENRRMINKEGLDNPKKYMKNILLRGESGSGKTMIIENITKLLNIPTFIADSTQYTETGWAGDSVTDMLANLYHAAGDNLEAAEKGILFIDEVDKKASNDSHSGPSRGAVLDGLLKSIEGAVVPVNVGSKVQEERIMFDTTKLTVICSGAFEGIEEYRDRRIGKRKAGFEREISKEIDQGITDEDYIAYGMNRQFMSRLPKVVELNKCTKESLIEIMKKSNSSPLKIEKYILEDRGIEVEYTEDFYERLAEVALKMKIGARGISKALSKVLTNIHIENIETNNVSKIIFNKDTVDNPDKLIIIPRDVKRLIKE